PTATSPLVRLVPAIESPIVGETRPEPATPAVPDSVSPLVTESGTPEQPKSGSTAVRKRRTPQPPESDSDGPRYLQLVRKEARLRTDQVDALAQLRRRLSRRRANRDEVLTDNTLIRIAVDLLLGQADRLHGDTESELRRSVSP
ncbi:MAG: hypothetical protein JWO98_1512, partial [Frankiales bacterium]|nr:hypothetical protein [Frankiales bacterium]